MPYQVIKTIKGRSYLYEQETFREGQKVKTVSRYIGACDGAGKATSKAVQLAITVPPEVKENDSQAKYVSEEKPQPPKLTLQITTDLKGNHISQPALERNYDDITHQMQRQEIKAEHIKPLVLVKGFSFKYKSLRKQNKISIPKANVRGTRAKVWRSFHLANAHSYLDGLQKSDPQRFTGLQQHLETSYRKQNKAIAAHIMNSNRKDVYNIGLTLHFMYSKMVSAWTQRKFQAENFGLSNYEDRSSWRDDAALLMAEIQADGWHHCYDKYQQELLRTERALFRQITNYRKATFLDRLSGKRAKLKRACLRANARRRALFETCNKISVLSSLYHGYKNQYLNGNEPFTHEQNWQIARQRYRKKNKSKR